MRRNATLGRAAAAALIVLGVSSVPRWSHAGQSTPEQNRNPSSQSGQTKGTESRGTQRQDTQQGTQREGTQKQGSQAQGAQNQGANPTVEEPGAREAALVTATATIEKIDKSSGTVTLKTADGKTFDAKVGPAVDMDKLHVGDRVDASYYEEVAVAIRKHAEGAPKVATTTVLRGGVAAQQATLTAKIDSVDATKKEITFHDAAGRAHTLKVRDPALEAQLASIHRGDNLDVTYTQAVAVTVEPSAPREPAR